MASNSAETEDKRRPGGPLRRGWTTGACATAATSAAFQALLGGDFPDPVTIRLPRGETPSFALARTEKSEGWARASIIKDAGDDPDVTHGAEIVATLRWLPPGAGLRFKAGEGVGVVTRPGLPLQPGEPAINPVPRRMMAETIGEIAARAGTAADLEIEIGVLGGMEIAQRTWNPRLGIVGGLSILGTTGIVVPYSCAAWIASIHRGVDVARAAGLDHIAGATGRTSEAAAQARYGLAEIGMIDMGDFAGGLLKYVRTHPVPRVTIAGGFAKLSKLAQGFGDLHSSRGQVDLAFLAGLADPVGGALGEAIRAANTAAEALGLAHANGVPLAAFVAERACAFGRSLLGDALVALNILVVGRAGEILAETSEETPHG